MRKSIVGGFVGSLVAIAPGVVAAPSLSTPVLAQAFSPNRASNAVSPLELQQFIQAVKQLQKVQMETQEKLGEALKSERLSPERFQEIARYRSNPESPLSSPITPPEQERFDKAITKIQKIQAEAAPKQSRAITLQGLTVDRFNQIGAAIDANPTLQQQLRNR